MRVKASLSRCFRNSQKSLEKQDPILELHLCTNSRSFWYWTHHLLLILWRPPQANKCSGTGLRFTGQTLSLLLNRQDQSCCRCLHNHASFSISPDLWHWKSHNECSFCVLQSLLPGASGLQPWPPVQAKDRGLQQVAVFVGTHQNLGIWKKQLTSIYHVITN